MTTLKIALLAVGFGLISAPASIIRYDAAATDADADAVRTEYFYSALSAGPVPRWCLRLTLGAGLRRED